jgi:UDP-N-acetylglucosamine--N-acetylmuramyl-(pentapeptide) pyrophosphoryl-undecaprenol N-acetylglucosamine transferase
MGSQYTEGERVLAPRAYAVVAGGGTGGHVFPALAIADALAARGHDKNAIHFIGSARGMEARLVPEAGYPITLLPGRGIARRLTRDNIGAVIGLLRAVLAGISLIGKLRPRVVVTVGGYASVPAVIGAVVRGVPVVLHEQNAAPGLANRLASVFAKACAVSVPGTPLRKAQLTGNPVRADIAGVDRSLDGRAAARADLGLPDGRRVVAAVGGSLGARTINTSVRGLAQRWRDRRHVAIRHVIGRRDFLEHAVEPLPPGDLVYQAVEFEDRVPLLLAAADVVIARAGATTVAELAAAGVPSILVPLPGAPGDHQTANARALTDRGAAVLVPDAECTPERLEAELEPLLADPVRLDAMGRAAHALAHPDAADRVADLVERHARP